MSAKNMYLLLCFFGAALPLWQFFPFLLEHGLNIRLFFKDLFANNVSGFFAMDVLVSGIVVITYVFIEGRRLQIKNAWIALLGLCVGVSLALPMFLYMKQRHIESHASS